MEKVIDSCEIEIEKNKTRLHSDTNYKNKASVNQIDAIILEVNVSVSFRKMKKFRKITSQRQNDDDSAMKHMHCSATYHVLLI